MSTQSLGQQLLSKLGLYCLRLVVYFPYPALVFLGTLLGHIGYWLMRRRRGIAYTNIKLCFPTLSATEHRRIVIDTFHSIGISIFETALSWWASDKKLAGLCHLEGLEHLLQAQAKPQGVLLLSAHFTPLEIGGRLLAMHAPFAVMYKSHRNPIMEAAIVNSRQQHYQKAIPQHDLRGFIRALQDNMTCWYAPDQDLGIRRGVFAPFFNIPAATITAPSRFASISKATVVPFFTTRRKDGRGYNLKLLPALKDFPSNDLVFDATRINQIIETQAKETPGQYLWPHRRFKTRPSGESSVYE